MTATAAEQQASGRRRLAAEIGIGLVIGFMLVAFLLSFASLLFAEWAPEYLAVGVGLILLAAVFQNLVSARWSTMPGAVILPQDASTAVVAAGLAGILPAVLPDQRPGTILIYTAACTVAAGVAMVALGAFRWGGLVRFVPISVIGGFLAGTGWLLVRGGAELVTAGFTFDMVHVLSLSGAAAFAVTLLLILRFRPSVLAVPSMVGAGVALFFVLLAVAGISLPEARSLGLLPATGGGSFRLPVGELASVDWSSLWSGLGGIVSVPLVTTMALLLNVSALDLMRGEDTQLDRELRRVGVANLFSALGGAPAGYHALGPTGLAFRVGVISRVVPATVAGVCLLAAMAGSRLVGLVPVPVVGGLLLFLGLGFMADWLIDRRRQMSAPEFMAMLTIVAVVAMLGLLAAVAWGMVAAVILFVVAYSRIDPIRYVGTGRERRSNVDRDPASAAFLDESGDALLVVELQGYLFFGTAHAVVDRIRAMADQSGPLGVLVVDLGRVQGADSTALTSFAKLARLTEDMACRLIVSDVPGHLRGGLDATLSETQWTPATDLDHALEVGEETLLEGRDRSRSTCRDVFGPDLWRRVEAHLERREAAAGDLILEHGDHQVGLVAVEQGEIVTEIPSGDGWRRVRRSGPGTVVGEMSLYRGRGRSARVRAVGPTVVYYLDGRTVEEMERTEPQTAAELHRLLAGILAERLAHGNEVVRSLLG